MPQLVRAIPELGAMLAQVGSSALSGLESLGPGIAATVPGISGGSGSVLGDAGSGASAPISGIEGGVGAGTVTAPPVSATGGDFIPGVTPQAGSGVLKEPGFGLNTGGDVIPNAGATPGGGGLDLKSILGALGPIGQVVGALGKLGGGGQQPSPVGSMFPPQPDLGGGPSAQGIPPLSPDRMAYLRLFQQQA